MAMMIYDMTLQHQAGRRMSVAEQRRADEQLGRMAARVSRAWRRQGEHGLQGRDRGVQRSRPQPRDGQVGVREHLAPAAVPLARARTGRVQPGGVLQFAGGCVSPCFGPRASDSRKPA
jgi:hypothetical protein